MRQFLSRKRLVCFFFALLCVAVMCVPVFADTAGEIYLYRTKLADNAGASFISPIGIHIPRGDTYTVVTTPDGYYTITYQGSSNEKIYPSQLTPYVLDSVRKPKCFARGTTSTPPTNGAVSNLYDIKTNGSYNHIFVSTNPQSYSSAKNIHCVIQANGGSFSDGATTHLFDLNCDYWDFYFPMDIDIGLIAPEGKVFRGWTTNYNGENFHTHYDVVEPITGENELETVFIPHGSLNADTTFTIKAEWKDAPVTPDEPENPPEYVNVSRYFGLQWVGTFTAAYGVDMTLPNEDFYIPHYIFRGWYYDEEFTAPVLSTDVPTSDCNIYAKMDYVGGSDVSLSELVDTLWSNFFSTFTTLTSQMIIGGVSILTILTALLVICLVYLVVKLIRG